MKKKSEDMSAKRTKEIALLALFSRVLCTILAFVSHYGLQANDQRNTILFDEQTASTYTYEIISPLIQWDGVHFLNIALHGHDAVLSHAFFPGLPMVMRGLYSIMPSISGDVTMDFSIFGLVFVQVSFILASVGLYKLSCVFLLDEKTAFRSTLFYVFASSNIFMSALYTESPFSMFTFWGIYWLHVRGNLGVASIMFTCASVLRSNGILAIVYLMMFGIKTSRIYDAIVAAMVVYLPYLLYSMNSWNQYCDGHNPQSWCGTKSIYEHVQMAFWRVSFLSYWNMGNWPYFLLMTPSLLVALHAPFYYLKDLMAHEGDKLVKKSMNLPEFLRLAIGEWTFPFLVQMGILSFFTVFIANCQILTRILSSCPLYFWTINRITTSKPSEGRLAMFLSKTLWTLHFTYYLVGPLVFSNGYNWT